MPNQNSSSSTTQPSQAQVLSPEARKALRKALKDQLSVVQKKVRHMQAKRLLGVKEQDDGKPKKAKGVRDDVQNDAAAAPMADRENHRGSNSTGGKGDRSDRQTPVESSARGRETDDGGGEGLDTELKEEAQSFFSKGTRPKTGKTKSVFASIMSSEQRSFAQDHKKTPSAQPSKKGGGGRKK